ncbi:SGNH/GDSL hydrolase family protein [Microcoleus sp. FACHB-1515]|nr:SGNH/GDSL hydrolase family protein [Microcoleus sp. FACHB-1515]
MPSDFRSPLPFRKRNLAMTVSGIAWAAIGVGVAIELLLRCFGLGNPLLYLADDQIGYLLAPNQTCRRFGKRIAINAFSMRSPAICPTRPPDALRVLLLGDSIAFGSRHDQADLISEQICRSLKGAIEVLNASASSWSPRNELAYLKRFGCFESQVVVLLINTDDLFGSPPNPGIVGRDRHYPSRKPLLAIAELIRRYRSPTVPPIAESGDIVGVNLQAIAQIAALAAQANAAFILAMIPLRRELEGSRDYEMQARQRLQDLTVQRQISYIDLLDRFQTAPHPAALYYDSIHLSIAGNQLVSQVLKQAIEAHDVSRH